jgi:uncharacterized membrane protein YdjX (TVP38/TMEM64 family)
VFLLLLLALAAAWRWTPLKEWLDIDSLVAAADYLHEGPYTPIAVAATYVVAGLVMFPVTVLNLVVIIVFGGWLGPVYAICGAALSAASTYGIGRRLGRERVQRLAGERLNRLSKRLAKRGMISMSLVRLVPIAPFTVVNVVAGASHIGFRDFMLGTVIGLAPGLIATALFVSRAKAVFTNPGADTVAMLAAVVVAIAVAVFFLRRRFSSD